MPTRQPVTPAETIENLPGLPWPNSDFVAKTPFGDFEANVTGDGVQWTWIGLKDEPKVEFLDVKNANVSPESLNNALWEVYEHHPEFEQVIVELDALIESNFYQ